MRKEEIESKKRRKKHFVQILSSRIDTRPFQCVHKCLQTLFAVHGVTDVRACSGVHMSAIPTTLVRFFPLFSLNLTAKRNERNRE